MDEEEEEDEYPVWDHGVVGRVESDAEAEWPAGVIYIPDLSSPSGFSLIRIERARHGHPRRPVGFHR